MTINEPGKRKAYEAGFQYVITIGQWGSNDDLPGQWKDQRWREPGQCPSKEDLDKKHPGVGY